MSILIETISTRVPESKKENIAAEALAGAQQHQHQQLPRRRLEIQVGEVVQVTRAKMQAILVGESRENPPDGTTKARQMEATGRVPGMMDRATRGTTTSVTPGATTSTKTTDPIPGQMDPNRSRAGAPVEMVSEEGLTATGGSLKKVLAQLAGTVTATDPALGVGVSQVEPTPAAATPG